jgi:hypothetical protein
MTRKQVSERLGTYYSRKLNGTVWASFDHGKRAYCIRGEGLPAHPDQAHRYPNGWSLLDHIKPTTARELIAQ